MKEKMKGKNGEKNWGGKNATAGVATLGKL